jgi:hypothetical protein
MGDVTGPGSQLPGGNKAGGTGKQPLAETGWNVKQNIARGKAVDMSAKLQQRAQAARDNPEEAAQRYDAARRSMFGEFASQPMTPVAGCLAKDKAARRKQRLDLIARADACGCSPEASQRLRRDMDEVENMRVAKYVYLANDPDAPPELRNQPPAGFTLATDQQLKSLGLTKDMLEPDGTNFRALVCVKDPQVWAPPDPPDSPFVLAFRGSTPELEDWENNMMQGIDKAPGFLGEDGTINKAYYQRAVEIGKAIGKRDPVPGVHLVGHSLGGGLASAAQGGSGGATGISASTFNAAGLNSGTMQRYGGAVPDASKIRALRITGEVLTKSQEKGMSSWVAPGSVGTKEDIAAPLTKDQYLKGPGAFDKAAAKAAGTKFDADEEYAGHLHGMDVVIDAMEQRKQADQALLEQCGAPRH